MKLVLGLAILLSCSMAQAAKYDFVIEGQGIISHLPKEELGESFLTYNLIQSMKTDKTKCELNLRATSLSRLGENNPLSEDYLALDKSFCQLKGQKSSIAIGMLSPEWTQTNGLTSANLFSSYDLRYSFFLNQKMQFYNPGIQFDYYFDKLTFRTYVGKMMNPYKIDEVNPTILETSFQDPEKVDVAAGLFAAFDDLDLNLYWMNIVDRIGIYTLNPTLLGVDRVFYDFSALGLSLSTTAHGWGVFRMDFLQLQNRFLTDNQLTLDQVSHNVLVVGIETPTILDTIYSFQYSTQHLGLAKKYHEAANSEWMTHTFRYNANKENVFQIDYAHNHFDKSDLLRVQYTWPHRRLTELTIGTEVYRPSDKNYFFTGFQDYSRVYLKFDINVSI